MPDPAEALYPGGPKENLGPEPPQENMIVKNKKLLEQVLHTGMQALGFGGGAMGIVSDIVNATDHSRLLNPMARLHEFRQSKDYKGNKPEGDTKEETQRLRSLVE